MIQKLQNFSTKKILFKNWTRNSWAVFASLKIVVHNHCTKISSFKDSLMKQQGANRSEFISLFYKPNEQLEYQQDIGITLEEESLLIESQITSTIREVYEKLCILRDNYKIPVDLFCWQGFLYFIKNQIVSTENHKCFNNHIKMKSKLFLLYCLSIALSCFGQNDSTKIDYTLTDVVVTASHSSLPLSQISREITIISKEEIQALPIQSIQDLLNYVSGVDILQRGGHGVQADVAIRGGSFDQTAILLNGINLSNPQTGHQSFNLPINLNDIERIEILHGPASFIYGASAFSGGINIITKKNPDYKIYTNIEGGQHNLWGLELGGFLKSGISSNQLSIGYDKSDGYIANSDYKILSSLWQTRLNVRKTVIDIQLGYNDKKYGANTFYSPLYPNQYDKTKSYLGSIRGEIGSILKFTPTLYWNQQCDEFQLIRGDESKVPFNYHRTDVYGANLNVEYEWNFGNTAFGAEFRSESILSSVLGKALNNAEGKFTKGADRTNISYVLEHTYRLENIFITGGIMSTYNTSLKGKYHFYPTLGISYRPIDDMKIYASWSKASRLPTFTDLYYNTITHSGNVNLKQERSESFDVGMKYTNKYIDLSATTYLMYGRNIIDWVRSEGKWQSMNHTSINKIGFDIEAKFNLDQVVKVLQRNTSILIAYSQLNQEGDDISPDQSSNYVLNYLRDKFVIRLYLPIYQDRLISTINFRLQKRKGTYDDYSQGSIPKKKEFNSFSIMDLMLKYKITQNWNINLSINNLYNTHYFDLGSIPQAGFWMIGGVSYTIR